VDRPQAGAHLPLQRRRGGQDFDPRSRGSRPPFAGEAHGPQDQENKPFFEDVARAIADAGAILIVGPAQEKDLFAKFLAEKHPAVRAHVEGVGKADHPTDGELLDFARRFVKAADRMRP
jgi:hypothetical protein